jgi:hypothetical protein
VRSGSKRTLNTLVPDLSRGQFPNLHIMMPCLIALCPNSDEWMDVSCPVGVTTQRDSVLNSEPAMILLCHCSTPSLIAFS